MPYTSVTPHQIAGDDTLADWRVLVRRIHADFVAPSFNAGGALVLAIAAAADAADHHPDVDLRYPGRVHVMLTTHAVGGLSDADVDLARTISALAREHGATAEPTSVQISEIAIDTTDAARIRPFWAAVLGYRERETEVVDPDGIGPTIWFQHTHEARAERSRFHWDVVVPHEVAEARVAAAIEAGGRLVTDEFARAWWVLADADGNEACVCTWQDRATTTS